MLTRGPLAVSSIHLPTHPPIQTNPDEMKCAINWRGMPSLSADANRNGLPCACEFYTQPLRRQASAIFLANRPCIGGARQARWLVGSRQQFLQRIAEFRKLKLEAFLVQPFRNDVASVEGKFRIGTQK